MNKAVILAIIDAAIKEHLQNFQDNQEIVRGPRGFRGKDGLDFNFEDHEIKILNIIKKTVDDNHEKFKLKFSDLNQEEKEYLKLKFDELTEDQKLEITGRDGKDGKDFSFDDLTWEQKQQLRGPRGQRGRTGVGKDGQDGRDGKDFDFEEVKDQIYSKLYEYFISEKESLKGEKGDAGEKGEKGARGQRGKQGLRGDSAYQVWLENNDGTEEDFLLSLKGEDGKSIRGPIGPAGKDGKSIVGPAGEDGKDAAEIIDIEIEQLSREEFIFKFLFSDGREIETSRLKLPSTGLIYQSVASGGGGSGSSALSILDGGTAVGDATSLNFINADDVSVDGTDPNQINVTLPTGGGGGNCVAIDDEGIEVTDCATRINFVGENVYVANSNVIAGWPSLDVVDNMATYGDSGTVNVIHEESDAERLTKTFVAGEDITQNDFVRLATNEEVFVATNNATYEEAQVIGIALSTETTGNAVSVLLFGVYDENNTFSFTINNPFFLGVNGAAIQNPPTSVGEFVVEIGQSLGVGAIFLDVSRPQEIV